MTNLMNTRYNKIFRDLTVDIPKNLMLVAAIAIGVFGIGTILGGYTVLKREMAANYSGTSPASATIRLEGASIERTLVDSVSRFDGIVQAERHATVSARMKIGDDWYPMLLFVVDDFEHMKANTVSHVSGSPTPQTGAMLVERTAHRVMRSMDGTVITVKTPNGQPSSIRIAGTVHDPGLAPAWQEKTGYAYITLSTLHLLGETQGFDELKIIVPKEAQTSRLITQKAKEVCTWLEGRGYTIHEVQVPPPNRHPHQGQMNAILLLFTVFSFLLLCLSSILVASSIAALMVRQIREIGIMKTIGASSGQISMLYIVMIVILCVLALAIAVPLSTHSAVFFAEKIAELLNLRIFDSSIPPDVPLIQMVSGILIPLCAACVPVFRGSRIRVRKAMENYGVSQTNGGKGSFVQKLTARHFFGETFALSLRNVFRQRSRLIMSLGLLSAGGAMFITALNVSKAWDVNLEKIYQQRFYDVDIRLHQPVSKDELTPALKAVSGIRSVEAWNSSTTSFGSDVSYDIVQTYPDKGHGSFSIIGIPVPTRMISLPILAGTWLTPESGNDVVFNHMALALRPGMKIGDSVALSIDNTAKRWRIIGFVEDLYSPATGYVPLAAYEKTGGIRNCTNMLRLTFADRDKSAMTGQVRDIEEAFNRNKISIAQSIPVSLFRNAIGEHMGVLVNSLIAMAILMALVGTLGLTSTMSMNIMERTREIGVMRAIGATPKTIGHLVLWEGLVTGLMSIIFSIVLSLAMSSYLGQWLGEMAFRSPLSLTVSGTAIFLWTAIIVGGSLGATLYPARRANRITTREALAYE